MKELLYTVWGFLYQDLSTVTGAKFLEGEMAKTPAAGKRGKIDEANLTKGQLRKLNALRKSLGARIAEKAFAEWLAAQPTEKPAPEDKVAIVIAGAVEKALAGKNMNMPRGGYLVKRGRGRIIVTPAR